MTNEQMLKELIELAINRGWDDGYESEDFFDVKCTISSENYRDTYYWEAILFNHDFVKAIFSDEEVNNKGETRDDWLMADNFGWQGCGLKEWQHHLQQLAITPEQDRIKYAWENRIK